MTTNTTARNAFVPPAAPRTPKARRTRERLLEVAGDLFIERGFAAVSIRDIAAATGLTNGAVYGHFRSKGQLLVEVIRRKLAERDEVTDFSLAAADAESGVELMYDERYRQIRMLEVDAAAAARHDTDVAAGLSELYAQRHERIRQAAAALGDPEAAAWLIEALTAGIGMKESAGQTFPEPDRLRAALLGMIGGLPTAT